jgi:radical SAM-linked protein
MRLFERALRRAELPVAMSQGFHPRPRLSLPVPLRVGQAGLNEVADIGLHQWMRPDELCQRLQAQMPEGIGITSAGALPPGAGRQPTRSVYKVDLLDTHTVDAADVERVLRTDSVVVERRRKNGVKQVDVRRFIETVRLTENALHLVIACLPEGTARPGEVLTALGCRDGTDYTPSCITRTNVSLSA